MITKLNLHNKYTVYSLYFRKRGYIEGKVTLHDCCFILAKVALQLLKAFNLF